MRRSEWMRLIIVLEPEVMFLPVRALKSLFSIVDDDDAEFIGGNSRYLPHNGASTNFCVVLYFSSTLEARQKPGTACSDK